MARGKGVASVGVGRRARVGNGVICNSVNNKNKVKNMTCLFLVDLLFTFTSISSGF